MKKPRNTRPSTLNKKFCPCSIIALSARMNSIAAARKENGISFQTVECFTLRGVRIAHNPRISSMFAMLLPIMFPNEMSAVPFNAAKMLTNVSGSDVPNATMVSPITSVGMPNRLASDVEPSTRKSAPFTSRISPAANKRYSIILFFWLCVYLNFACLNISFAFLASVS